MTSVHTSHFYFVKLYSVGKFKYYSFHIGIASRNSNSIDPAFRSIDSEYVERGMEMMWWQTDRRNHAVLLLTIVTNFAVSTELLVSGPIASKACNACGMGVTTNTLPETSCLPEGIVACCCCRGMRTLVVVGDPQWWQYATDGARLWQWKGVVTFGNVNTAKYTVVY
jgi:hypothetical protein